MVFEEMPKRERERRKKKSDADRWAPLVITVNVTVKINRVDFATTSALTGGSRMS